MPYTAQISRLNPTCFLFLIDQSGSMADTWGRERSKGKESGQVGRYNQPTIANSHAEKR